jgi:hypothetical protein
MPKKPEQTEPERSPAETQRLAREVMKRMLATPPTPHDDKKRKRKRNRPLTKNG